MKLTIIDMKIDICLFLNRARLQRRRLKLHMYNSLHQDAEKLYRVDDSWISAYKDTATFSMQQINKDTGDCDNESDSVAVLLTDYARSRHIICHYLTECRYAIVVVNFSRLCWHSLTQSRSSQTNLAAAIEHRQYLNYVRAVHSEFSNSVAFSQSARALGFQSERNPRRIYYAHLFIVYTQVSK